MRMGTRFLRLSTNRWLTFCHTNLMISSKKSMDKIFIKKKRQMSLGMITGNNMNMRSITV